MNKQSQKVINWRKRTKEKMVASMGGKCQICGYDKCVEALEFHHLDPTQKEYSFAKLRARPQGIEVIKEELKKCILLCSNCHKEVHYNGLDIPSDYAKLNEECLISELEIKRRLKNTAHSSSG